jgi:hypothetical protein
LKKVLQIASKEFGIPNIDMSNTANEGGNHSKRNQAVQSNHYAMSIKK